MGWFVVTIIVPLVAPILLMAIYGVVQLPPRFKVKTKLVVPINDGQFCWVGMAFCASAMYELASARGHDGQAIQYTTLIWSAAMTAVAAGIHVVVHFSITG
jgi:hypothetical protein